PFKKDAASIDGETDDFATVELKGDRDLGQVIVHQKGRTKAIISKHERDYWVNIRGKSKDPDGRLFATLATGEWDVAEADARALLRKQPKNATALQVLTASLAMQGKTSLAAFYGGLLEKYHPGSVDTLNIR